jgi:hypothetical protein
MRVHDHVTSTIVAVAILAGGCSKPASESLPPPAKPVVHWSRNEQGLITSGVQTNDFQSSTSPDGAQYKEVLDTLEDAPEFAEAFRDANNRADFSTKHLARQMGRAHMFWKKKKEVLRERYQIDWKSPEELNPMTTYD